MVNESRTTRFTRLLLAGGVVGPALFVVVFLIEGATRPGYNAWRNFVSQLSTGEGGWLQIANFIMCGLLCVGFALALWSPWSSYRTRNGFAWGPALLTIFGLGLIVAGIFVTDSALDYPPGAPLGQTWHGAVHGVAGLIVFGVLAATCFVYAWRFRGDPDWKNWAVYSGIAGATIALGFIASTVSSVLDERGIVPDAPTGLIQRIAIIAGWGWVVLFALRLYREPHLLALLGQVSSSSPAGGAPNSKTRSLMAAIIVLVVLVVSILVVLWIAGVFRSTGTASGGILQIPL